VASNYPGSLDSFDTIASDKKTSDSVGGRTHRDMHNDLGDAIEAVQTELGTDPAGASATVKARFEAIEASGWVTSTRILDGTIVNADINASAAIARTKLAQPAYAAKTSAYTATAADDVLHVTSGTFTLDLPEASTCAGKTLRIKNGGTGVVTLDGNSSETVEGVATFPLGPNSYVEITSTGSAWILTGGVPDTGLREIAVDGTNWSGNLRYRRIGNMVWYRTTALTMGVGIASGSAWTAAVVPAGFRVQGDLIVPTRNTSSGQVSGMLISGSGAGSYYGTLTAGQAIIFGGVGTTNDAWPTSLPGTAV